MRSKMGMCTVQWLEEFLVSIPERQGGNNMNDGRQYKGDELLIYFYYYYYHLWHTVGVGVMITWQHTHTSQLTAFSRKKDKKNPKPL